MLKATVDGQNYNPTRKSVFDSPDVQKSMKSWGLTRVRTTTSANRFLTVCYWNA